MREETRASPMCSMQNKQTKNQMTRIISGRNIRFMYIYMFISDQLRSKKEKREEVSTL